MQSTLNLEGRWDVIVQLNRPSEFQNVLLLKRKSNMLILFQVEQYISAQKELRLTVIFALASSTCHAGLWGDRHQGLSDGLLPALGHLHAYSRGGQSRAVVVTAVVLPYIINHGGCDDLKAVWVAALRQITVVSGLFHLQDLRQRDFLWGEGGPEITTNKTWNTRPIYICSFL